MERTITGFYRDDDGHWIARLDCGHDRHVRHRPPVVERPWVTTEAGRRDAIGRALACRLCDVAAPAGGTGDGDVSCNTVAGSSR